MESFVTVFIVMKISDSDSSAFITDFADGFVYDLRGKGFARTHHPHALFFPHGRDATNRSQNDFVLRGLQFQGISRGQLQFVAHRFGQNQASGSIDGKRSGHGISFTITITISTGMLKAKRGCSRIHANEMRLAMLARRIASQDGTWIVASGWTARS
jgi:hypothetical protein